MNVCGWVGVQQKKREDGQSSCISLGHEGKEGEGGGEEHGTVWDEFIGVCHRVIFTPSTGVMVVRLDGPTKSVNNAAVPLCVERQIDTHAFPLLLPRSDMRPSMSTRSP